MSLDHRFMTAEEAEDDVRAFLIAYDHAKTKQDFEHCQLNIKA